MDDITNWKKSFLASNSKKQKDLLKELSTDGKPLISEHLNSNDNGIVYLGNHRHNSVTFTIVGKKNGDGFVKEITTNLPTFYQGLDFGNNETLVIFLNGVKYVASPFYGLSSIVYW